MSHSPYRGLPAYRSHWLPALLRGWLGVATTLVVAAGALTARAQVPTQLSWDEWSAQDPQPFNQYGGAVAMEDGWAAIGHKDAFGGGQGAVEMYQWSGGAWTFRQTLLPNDLHAHDFGAAVALQGGVLAVGDNLDDETVGRGAVHLFKLSGSTWVFKDKVLNPGPTEFPPRFGASVATFGNVLVVGDSRADVSGSPLGAAYVFRRNPSDIWNFEAQLTAPPGEFPIGFGQAVALHNTLILAGSVIGGHGRVYVFRRSGGAWVPDGFVEAPTPADSDSFGVSMALVGTRVVFGGDDGLVGKGAVHVFEDDGSDLDFVAKLTAPDGAAGDVLGRDVALDGDLLVASAPGAKTAGSLTGAAFVWREVEGAFVPERWLRASDAAANEDQLQTVAVEGDHVLAGVPVHDHGSSINLAYGAVYAFLLNWDDLGLGLAGTHGVPALAGTGPLLPGTTLSLSLSGALANSLAYLFLGFDRIDVPFKGGVLVPAFQPPLGILVPLATNGSGALAVSAPWPVSLPAGVELFVQVWIADPGAAAGVAGSNALRGSAVAP